MEKIEKSEKMYAAQYASVIDSGSRGAALLS